MGPFGTLVFVLIFALVLGGSGVVLAIILIRGRRGIGKAREADEGFDEKAERLHRLVQPDDDAPD